MVSVANLPMDGIAGVDLGRRRELPAAQVRRTRSAAPALSAGGRQTNWRLVRDLGPQAPTYRRSTGVLHDCNTGQELPCVRNSRKPLDDTNAVTGHKINNPRP